MTSQERRERFTRRRMLWQAAVASGVGAIFKMTEGPASAQGRGGGGAGRGGAPAGMGMGPGRGPNIRYGQINKYSAPSDLRITDMRAVTVASNYDYNIIRLDTNQGVYGLGEVRDGGNKNTALALKPYVVGQNPLNIGDILRTIRPFAGHGRQGGGYSAVDLALHDINGKVFGVPIWRLLGDKRRDRVRMYCDTTGSTDPKLYGERMLARKKLGFTFFKMDMRAATIGDIPGAFNNTGAMTDKGLAKAGELVAAVKDAIGWDAPLGVETSSGSRVPATGREGKIPVKDAIRIARFYEKFDLAWLEDLFNVEGFWDWQGYKQIREATTTKILTGEGAFGLEEGFKALIDNHAVDIVHPDPGTSGQCRETKRIADYANQHGVDVAIHMAGSPVGTMGAVHTAATIENFLAMECHAVDFINWWQELVTGMSKPFFDKGYVVVPDAPGLGLDLNEAVIKEHLRYPGYFEPTTEWDKILARPQAISEGYPHFDENGKWVTEREPLR
jgi:L-alanine-DL-glutamate epimerase-like enolase superfamily enzyme